MIEYNNNGTKTRQYSKGNRYSWYQANEINEKVKNKNETSYNERAKYRLDSQFFGSKTAHAKQRTAERKIDDRSIEYAKKNALKISEIYYDANGKPTQDYIGEKITAIVNPDTGNTVTAYKTSPFKAKLLKQKLKDKK